MKGLYATAIISSKPVVTYPDLRKTAEMTVTDKYDELIRAHKLSAPIGVMRPRLPPLEDYVAALRQIWESRWLTNMGEFHCQLEAALRSYLGAPHVSLYCNGTSALFAALKLVGAEGAEVITTPFTFPATVHVIRWLNAIPVFCDIDAETCTLDPEHLQRCITRKTKAILPVHLFGNPCDVVGIGAIARDNRIPVVYDGAHAFGVMYQGRPISSYGSATMLSFHATKLFSTGEGGALVLHDAALNARAELLKNFGIVDEETVTECGINAKMSEFAAAYGVVSLPFVDAELKARLRLLDVYSQRLSKVSGISIPLRTTDTKPNGAYMPIVVDETKFGMARDELHRLLVACNIYPRKYFYPLCSSYSMYAEMSGADGVHVAEHVASRVLCLPVYGTLDANDVESICTIIAKASG